MKNLLLGSARAFLLVGASALALGCAQPIPVLYDGLDEIRYTRCVLKPAGQKLYSSNYVDEFGGYRPGSEVKINMFSEVRVDLAVNKIPHHMVPAAGKFNAGNIEGFLAKYFVNSLEELGLGEAKAPASEEGDEEASEGQDPQAEFRLDLMKSATRSSVEQGIAAIGMTKAEVYMSLGPPAQLNFGTPALPLALETILEANRWVYYGNWAARFFTFGLAGKRVYTFDGTKLVQVH